MTCGKFFNILTLQEACGNIVYFSFSEASDRSIPWISPNKKIRQEGSITKDPSIICRVRAELKETEAGDWVAGQATCPHEEAKEVFCWSPELLCVGMSGTLYVKQRTPATDRVSFLLPDREVKLTQIKEKRNARYPMSKNEKFTSPLMLSNKWVVIQFSSDPCCLPGLCTAFLVFDKSSESSTELHQNCQRWVYRIK